MVTQATKFFKILLFSKYNINVKKIIWYLCIVVWYLIHDSFTESYYYYYFQWKVNFSASDYFRNFQSLACSFYKSIFFLYPWVLMFARNLCRDSYHDGAYAMAFAWHAVLLLLSIDHYFWDHVPCGSLINIELPDKFVIFLIQNRNCNRNPGKEFARKSLKYSFPISAQMFIFRVSCLDIVPALVIK